MTITFYITTFLLASLLLLAPGTLALPTDAAGQTTTGTAEIPITPLSPYLTALMDAIPDLPNPENAAALDASRKIIEDAINTFNRDNKHLLQLGEEEVAPDHHRICETTAGSPTLMDALEAINNLRKRGGRCVMRERCSEFSSWGTAGIGACTQGNTLWDYACVDLARETTRIAWGCLGGIGGAIRTGGRQVLDDNSNSDCRIYRK